MDKLEIQKSEESCASLEERNAALQKVIEEKEKKMAAHVEIVSQIIESNDENNSANPVIGEEDRSNAAAGHKR